MIVTICVTLEGGRRPQPLAKYEKKGGGGGGNRTRVLKPRGQGIYARILRFGFAEPNSRRPDSDPASSLGLSRRPRSEERRSSRLLTLDPRPPAMRGERRYLVKQRKLAVYRRVCAVQLFNEDLDHLGAPPCFCLLSRDLSPPCVRHRPGVDTWDDITITIISLV